MFYEIVPYSQSITKEVICYNSGIIDAARVIIVCYIS